MICSKNDSLSVDITVSALKKEEVVIIPTDTVYGFSGIVDVSGKNSLDMVFKIAGIKGRNSRKPLIHLIAKPEDIFLYSAVPVPEKILENWPGALTVIVPVKENCPLFYEGPTVAFRCPGDEWLRTVVEKTGAPVYSTSVNRAGLNPLETIADIKSEYNGEVSLIVDAGDTPGALPSTIVSLDNGKIKVIREGSVKLES